MERMESEVKSAVARAIANGDESAFAWINEKVIGDGISLSELLLTSAPADVGNAISSSMLATLNATDISEFLSISHVTVRVSHQNAECFPYEELVRFRFAARTQRCLPEFTADDFKEMSDDDIHYFLRLEATENSENLALRMEAAGITDVRAYLFNVIANVV